MKERIIQFGEGVFLRGFVDYFIHKLNAKGLFDGKVVIVQPQPVGRVGFLNEQDGKYNLYLRGIEGSEVKTEHTLIDSVARGVDPYANFEDFISLADNPDFRFIISNTTEAGIAFDDSCCLEDKPAASYPGKLTQLLYRRFKSGLNGFILLPCELIDTNGNELKKCVLQYAELWKLGGEFLDWINNENTFSNTLVDRIVTGYPENEAKTLAPDDKMLDTAELFHLWVIEGNFEAELPLQKAGIHVVWTDDVTPYKKRKVRILNGAHTSMVAIALLSGVSTVGECMGDENVYPFLEKCLFQQILPVIGATEDNKAFAKSVLERFGNPYIKHQLRSIALNSISKFSVRVLPTIIEYKEKNQVYPDALSMSLAALIEFYKTDAPTDNADIIAFIKESAIPEILSNEKLWGRSLSDMAEIVEKSTEQLKSLGAAGAMKWVTSK